MTILSPLGEQYPVAWTAPASAGTSAITDYLVEYRTSPSGTWTAFNDGFSNATTAAITGLVHGTAYDVRVSAISAVGTGTASSWVIATPSVAPDAPTGLALTAGNGQLNASWTAPANNGGSPVNHYAIENRTSPSGARTVFPDGVSTATTATITGLMNGSVYEVWVRTVNSFDVGAASVGVTGTPNLWMPAALGSSLALWLDADDPSTITLHGSTVSEWLDKSGNNRNATQGSAANRPVYCLSVQNGKNAITFDGASGGNGDFLSMPSGVYNSSPSIWIVMNKGSTLAHTIRLQNETEIIFPVNYSGLNFFVC